MNKTQDFQRAIIDQVLSQYPNKRQAVESMMKLLRLKKDAVYRRINGERNLSPDEIGVLARHYRLDLNRLIGPVSGLIQFSFNYFHEPIQGHMDYLQQLKEAAQTIASIDNVKVYYASQELPIFLYMQWPELVAFKFYMHGQTSWSFNYLDDSPFSFALTPFQELEIARQIANYYSFFDSIELWSTGIMDTTFNQVKFVAQTGRFESKEDALDIIHSLEELIRFLEQSTIRGYKRKDSEAGLFHLYQNQFISTGNTILAMGTDSQRLYAGFAAPNFVMTEDLSICQYIEKWFQSSLNCSEQIRQSKSAPFTSYFGRMRGKLKELTVFVEKHFD